MSDEKKRRPAKEQEQKAPKVQVEIDHTEHEGQEALKLSVPSGDKVYEFVICPVDWGLMEDVEKFGEAVQSDNESNARAVSVFLDKYVVGGKAAVPFFMGSAIFSAVGAYTNSYQDVELKN